MKLFVPILDRVFAIRNKALELHADVLHEASRPDCQRSTKSHPGSRLKSGRLIHHLIGLMILLNSQAKVASCFL
jgi:hypothetical protein